MRTPADALPRLARSAWIRSAAASVTDKACFLAITHSPNPASPTTARPNPTQLCRYVSLLSQPAHGRCQRIRGKIDLRRRREAAKANADRGVGERIGKTERAQHVGGLGRRRRASRAGRDGNARNSLDQGQRRDLWKREVEAAGQPLLDLAVDAKPRDASSEVSQ